jgi:hypothetical protein
MSRAAHAVESKAVVRIEVAVSRLDRAALALARPAALLLLLAISLVGRTRPFSARIPKHRRGAGFYALS